MGRVEVSRRARHIQGRQTRWASKTTRASRASQAEIREKEGIDKRQAERDEWSEVAAVRVGRPQPQLSG